MFSLCGLSFSHPGCQDASICATLALTSFYRTRVRSLSCLVSNSLTHSLTHSCLVNLIDMTLACEDANSRLVEVVAVADVDA